ncbi:MAG: polyprenyl synthetase family protein [Myxococcota bacterium]
MREDLESVERELRVELRSVAERIPEIGEHSFAGGGKRLRPLLVLLAARLCGYRGPRAHRIAVAVEYLHTASLLHDDVVDGAALRRGRPSVNARFGPRLAILVGDFMYARACQMLVEDGNLEILALYAGALREMTEGEVLQLAQSFDPHISEALYRKVIGQKTASLLAAACGSGAIVSGALRGTVRVLERYGWELGLAFQLVDDALDYSGVGEQLGKQPFQDLGEGKVTLPLVLALQRCSTGERDAISATLKSLSLRGAADPEAVAHVADCVERHRGVEQTLERARAHAAAARSRLDPLEGSPAKDALLALCDFVVRRRR